MRIIHAHGVYLVEPGSDRKADGRAAKRAGFVWHDFDRNHPQRGDCTACNAHVPNRYWWTVRVEVAAQLYHAVVDNPDQAPDTLALLQPHRPLGGEIYTGEPDPVPPPRDTQLVDTTPAAPELPKRPPWRSPLELSLGDTERDED